MDWKTYSRLGAKTDESLTRAVVVLLTMPQHRGEEGVLMLLTCPGIQRKVRSRLVLEGRGGFKKKKREGAIYQYPQTQNQAQ